MFKKLWLIFSEILDLSTPNTREKYLLKTKCLDFFSLQATAVDRCEALEFFTLLFRVTLRHSYKLGIYSIFQSLFLNACIHWHGLILCIIMVTTEGQDHLVYSVALSYYHTIIRRYDEIPTLFTSFNQWQQK